MTVKVGPTRQDVLKDGRHRTQVKAVCADGVPRTLTFVTSPEVPFVEGNLGDLWLPTMLVIAMRRGEDLELSDPISDRARAIARAQDILSVWYPRRMQRITVHAPDAEPERRRRRKPRERITGTMFTGGVDSFYSLTKNADRLGAIVYGFGIDVPLHKKDATDRTMALLRDVADERGVRLLTARTTIRKFLAEDTRWGTESHGVALATLATLFSPLLERVLIPSTHTYSVGFPWGSHPLLDELWSTPRLAIEHDGAEADRIQKIRTIADDPVARRHLRVCYMQFTETNCCRCFKCVRTMATLEAFDKLEHFTSFHESLDLRRLAAKDLRRRHDVARIRELHRLVARLPDKRDIAEVTEEMLQRAGAL